MTYTTRVIKDSSEIDKKLLEFLVEAFTELGEKKYPAFKNWRKFNMPEYMSKGRLVICYRDLEPVGVMMSRLCRSLFDKNLIMLKQDLLYAKPNTRAAWHLMNEFLDFGRVHADHIITMIGVETNIKPESLEKLGFEKREVIYRLEV